MLEKDPRSTADKVRLFRTRFSGLDHVHGAYDPQSGRSWQVQQPVTDKVVLNHLTGKRPLGIYLLTGATTKAVAVDFDDENANPSLDFVAAAAHYGIEAHIETSKSKGFHVWAFADGAGLSARKARAVTHHLLREIRAAGVEVFPKQDAIDVGRGQVGNFINVPLYGRAAREGRTVFVDPHNGLLPGPQPVAVH